MLHGRFTVRVLEPSPPAIASPPYYADDPVARAADNEREVVAPVPTGDRSWAQVVAERGDPSLTAWAQDRWLAAWRPLAPAPPGWDRCVREHRLLARHVLGPWRAARTGGADVGLRATFGGFGTPFCWDDAQLRVEHGHLVLQQRGTASGLRPDDLAEAARFAQVPDVEVAWCTQPRDVEAAHSTPSPDLRAAHELRLERGPAEVLADWLMAATLVAERVRWRLDARTRVHVDPRDLAVVLALERGTIRATVPDRTWWVARRGGAAAPELVDTPDHLDIAEEYLLAALGVPTAGA
ncbi:MAG: hypothetical protein JJT89_05165 [Nitriliruptoraceae bacterium]|nr:hypothetical protein [Nitriliruptoraceae bacterium]